MYLKTDWSKVCPTIEQTKEYFNQLELHVEEIQYDPDYPRVEVLASSLDRNIQTWAWDRWHGGGFWHRTYDEKERQP